MKSILLCGIEGHVCVQSTVLDLRERGFDVNVIVDAVSSRSMVDRYGPLFNSQITVLYLICIIHSYFNVMSTNCYEFLEQTVKQGQTTLYLLFRCIRLRKDYISSKSIGLHAPKDIDKIPKFNLTVLAHKKNNNYYIYILLKDNLIIDGLLKYFLMETVIFNQDARTCVKS